MFLRTTSHVQVCFGCFSPGPGFPCLLSSTEHVVGSRIRTKKCFDTPTHFTPTHLPLRRLRAPAKVRAPARQTVAVRFAVRLCGCRGKMHRRRLQPVRPNIAMVSIVCCPAHLARRWYPSSCSPTPFSQRPAYQLCGGHIKATWTHLDGPFRLIRM